LFILTACESEFEKAERLRVEVWGNYRALLNANQPDKAEELLQSHLAKDSNSLMRGELVDLYINTDQTKKLEQYLSINKLQLENYLLAKGYRHLAHKSFENRDWELASSLYSKAATWGVSNRPGVNACGSVTIEDSYNSVVSAYNSRKKSLLEEASNTFYEMFKTCHHENGDDRKNSGKPGPEVVVLKLNESDTIDPETVSKWQIEERKRALATLAEVKKMARSAK